MQKLHKKDTQQGNLFTDLMDKYLHDYDAGKGHFNRRVKAVTTRYLVEVGETGNLYYECDILDANTGEKLENFEIKIIEQKELNKLPLQFIEALITCAFSGVYCTLSDESMLILSFNNKQNK